MSSSLRRAGKSSKPTLRSFTTQPVALMRSSADSTDFSWRLRSSRCRCFVVIETHATRHLNARGEFAQFFVELAHEAALLHRFEKQWLELDARALRLSQCEKPLFFVRHGLSSTTNIDHRPRRRNKIRLVDPVAGFLFHDDAANFGHNFVVAGTAAKQALQIMIVLAEQACAQLSIGGQPDTRTESAKWLRHGSDESDFAAPVDETIFARRFAAFVRDGNHRPARFDPPSNFLGGHKEVTRPRAVRVEGHELDEAHNQVALARERSEGLHFVVIQAANQHGVNLYGTQRRRLRRVNPRHDSIK